MKGKRGVKPSKTTKKSRKLMKPFKSKNTPILFAFGDTEMLKRLSEKENSITESFYYGNFYHLENYERSLIKHAETIYEHYDLYPTRNEPGWKYEVDYDYCFIIIAGLDYMKNQFNIFERKFHVYSRDLYHVPTGLVKMDPENSVIHLNSESIVSLDKLKYRHLRRRVAECSNINDRNVILIE